MKVGTILPPSEPKCSLPPFVCQSRVLSCIRLVLSCPVLSFEVDAKMRSSLAFFFPALGCYLCYCFLFLFLLCFPICVMVFYDMCLVYISSVTFVDFSLGFPFVHVICVLVSVHLFYVSVVRSFFQRFLFRFCSSCLVFVPFLLRFVFVPFLCLFRFVPFIFRFCYVLVPFLLRFCSIFVPWPWPVASATGQCQWPWLLAMAIGHGNGQLP